MNNERRKRIAEAQEMLERLDALRSEALQLVEELAQEERDYADNMPENMQGGERYERANEAADKLEEVQGELDGFDVQALVDQLNEAAE